MGWLTAGLLACAPPVAEQQSLEGRWTAEARLGPEAMTLLLDIVALLTRADFLDLLAG
jgi:hypothetical protein